MAAAPFSGSGTSGDPWVLKTPSLGSEIMMYRDEGNDPPVLVCTVGSTVLHYDLRIIEDLHQMLKERGDWVPLGNADEQKPAPPGRSRNGRARRTTPSVAGTASRKASAAGSATMFRRFSRPSAWPRWNRTPATIG
jgi:hypothetical protein